MTIFNNVYSIFQMFTIIKYQATATSTSISVLKLTIEIMSYISIYINVTLGISPRLKKKTNILFRYNIYNCIATEIIVTRAVNVLRKYTQFTLNVISTRLYSFTIHKQSIVHNPTLLSLTSCLLHPGHQLLPFSHHLRRKLFKHIIVSPT